MKGSQKAAQAILVLEKHSTSALLMTGKKPKGVMATAGKPSKKAVFKNNYAAVTSSNLGKIS